VLVERWGCEWGFPKEQVMGGMLDALRGWDGADRWDDE
jgi:hypothetical protein